MHTDKKSELGRSNNKVFFLFLLCHVVAGIVWSVFGPLIPIFSKYFDVGLEKIGFMFSLNSFGLLLAVILSGYLAEIINKKTVLIIGISLVLSGLAGIAASSSFIIFIISFFIIGIGTGAILLSINDIVCNIFKDSIGKKLLLLGLAFSIGIFVGPLIVSLNLSIGWDHRSMFLFLIILEVLVLIFIVRSPRISISIISHLKRPIRDILSTYRRLLSNKYILICLGLTFLHTGIAYSFLTWFTTYFLDFGIIVERSSILLSIFAVALIAGMFLKNRLLKFFKQENILLVSSVMALVSFIAFLFLNPLVIKMIFVFIFGLNITGIFVLSVAIAMSLDSKNTGILSSLLFSSGYIGNIVFHYSIGYYSERISVRVIPIVEVIALTLMAAFTMTIFLLLKKPAQK